MSRITIWNGLPLVRMYATIDSPDPAPLKEVRVGQVWESRPRAWFAPRVRQRIVAVHGDEIIAEYVAFLHVDGGEWVPNEPKFRIVLEPRSFRFWTLVED